MKRLMVIITSLIVASCSMTPVFAEKPNDWKESSAMYTMLERVGDESGLPRGMSHVLAYGESRFLPTVISKDGQDRGLCQLGKAWQADLVWRYFRNKDGTPRIGFDWRNPEHNATVGCRYLADLIDRFGGSVYLGMVAYNWGPGHVARMTKWSEVPRRTIKYVDRTLALLDAWDEGWREEK